MRVLIHFDADDTPKGQIQTLYADMTQKEYDAYQAIISDPAQGDDILYINSRVKRDGPANDWMFRVSRIRLEKER